MQRLCIQGFVLCKEFFVHKSYKLNFRIYLTFQQGFAFNFFVNLKGFDEVTHRELNH